MAVDADQIGDGYEVVVVDDDDALRAYLQRALEHFGCTVHEAPTLEDAREILKEHNISVVMLDQELPDGSGLDFLEEISANGIGVSVAIITGHGQLDAAIRALRLGATDYVQKPFADISDLKACLENCLRAVDRIHVSASMVEELKERNDALEALALRDPLTHLYSHVHFQSLLADELQRSKTNNSSCALLLVRVDMLRSVNEGQGHKAGDTLLRAIAEILAQVGRGAEGVFKRRAQDVVARYSGKTMALILPDTPPVGASVVAERLRRHIENEDFSPLGLPSQTVSIGLANYPQDASDKSTLIENAGLAMETAYWGGKNRLVTYTTALTSLRGADSEEIQKGLELLDRLDDSIANDRFNFVYQPIVTCDGSVIAYEALCRPQDNIFPHPGVLIDTAERAGRVVPLGRCIRRLSIRALDELPESLMLFVNIHPHELFDPEIVNPPPELAKRASQIVFEVTEVAGLKDYGRVREIMSTLRGMGYRIALDDLGAGYSGLNALASLHPDFVKLDMGLIRKVHEPQTARLTRHIVEYAVAEGMEVIAEGIETAQDKAALEELGCKLLQGYFFAKGKPIAHVLTDRASTHK